MSYQVDVINSSECLPVVLLAVQKLNPYLSKQTLITFVLMINLNTLT